MSDKIHIKKSSNLHKEKSKNCRTQTQNCCIELDILQRRSIATNYIEDGETGHEYKRETDEESEEIAIERIYHGISIANIFSEVEPR